MVVRIVRFRKTLRALLRGYLCFDVNGYRFTTYGHALSFRDHVEPYLLASDGFIQLKGWNIVLGWRLFSLKQKNPAVMVWIDEAQYITQEQLDLLKPTTKENTHGH